MTTIRQQLNALADKMNKPVCGTDGGNLGWRSFEREDIGEIDWEDVRRAGRLGEVTVSEGCGFRTVFFSPEPKPTLAEREAAPLTPANGRGRTHDNWQI